MKIQAVIFDLDGVIVTTDHCHYMAWQKMAHEEQIPFDESTNERLRGISRMESLDIVLEKSPKVYTPEEKLQLAQRKNSYYVAQIQKLTPQAILPGVLENIAALQAQKVKIAIGSSSRNTPLILRQIGLEHRFDAVVDGNQIQNSKPDPEVFLKAAELLQVSPENCMVVEDADAGILAAKRAGMVSLAVKNAKGGDFLYESLAEVNIADLF